MSSDGAKINKKVAEELNLELDLCYRVLEKLLLYSIANDLFYLFEVLILGEYSWCRTIGH